MVNIRLRKSILQKKIFRDTLENRGALIAVVFICTLGIALFSGINLYVHTVEQAVEDSYATANLADYWIYKADVSDSDIERILSLLDVKTAERRKMTEGILADANATLRIHAASTQNTINLPELIEGENLNSLVPNELLLDYRFAEEHGIKIGNSIQLSIGGGQQDWIVKGIVRSAEYIFYAPDGLSLPDYNKYGFAYANDSAFETPYNELVVTLRDNAAGSPQNDIPKFRETLGTVNIISRLNQSSVSSIHHELEKFKKIGLMLPVVFFLTAALVTWITVGRMMENQRQHLGTLRSVGYSKKEIIARYAVYGMTITVFSMIPGAVIARLLAGYLYSLGISYYSIPKTGVSFLSLHFLLAALCVCFVTCGAVVFSCGKSLKVTPAALMRPAPPAKGHRILLERISPYWSRLSFSGKIVTRNLFRNKARLVMGLVGVIGSVALLVCGFGLKDSADNMILSAFDKTMRYDVEIKLKQPVTLAEIERALPNADTIDAAMSFSVYIYGEDGNAQNPYLVTLNDDQTALRFTDEEGKPVSLPEFGVLITPRMSEALHANIGDELIAEILDGTKLTLEVGGIVDFPVGNEIYISRTAFSKISPLVYTPRAFLVSGQDLDISGLKNDPRIALVEHKSEMEANLRVILKLLQTIQAIMILFAGGLAFAVMMVLGRLNFHERIRELATLKVLGFHKNEMKRLVLRENIWITVFALIPGTFAGFGLLRVILMLARTPDSQSRPFVSAFSFLAVAVLAVGFTLLVNYIMGRKFKSVDMVASLKSVE